jgi:mannan endo-1,4-beta-mannosidase
VTPYRRLAVRWARREAAKARRYVDLVTCVAIVIAAAVSVIQPWKYGSPHSTIINHSTQSQRYLAVYEPDAPGSYTDLDEFAQSIGKQPNLVSYYSSLTQPFRVNFARSAASRGAITLDQIGATNVPLESIVRGKYDHYLRSYAAEVKAFGRQVIVSFDHEMNGSWYSWGYQHQSAAEFIAAWRHIVNLFREQGTTNVTWLWTVNVINTYNNRIPDPVRWWPGSSYVDWVGIDGYYYNSSWTFSSLFGPTIIDVRKITSDPILIAETGASPSADQPAKITDLFAGVHTYGLLGFLWFDMYQKDNMQDWRITSPAAKAAFRRDAKMYMKP